MKVEVSREISVSPEDFYDYMVGSVCEQINIELQTNMKPEDIKSGYTHKLKQTNNKQRKNGKDPLYDQGSEASSRVYNRLYFGCPQNHAALYL